MVFYLKCENTLSMFFFWKANLVQKVTRVWTKGVKKPQATVQTSLLVCLMTGQSMVKALLQASSQNASFKTLQPFQSFKWVHWLSMRLTNSSHLSYLYVLANAFHYYTSFDSKNCLLHCNHALDLNCTHYVHLTGLVWASKFSTACTQISSPVQT